MTNIEKRACDMKVAIKGGYVPDSSLKSYFLGELEKQRNIDAEKAAELYREEVQQMKLMLNHFKRGAGDLIKLETSVEQFKKKLMEQE